MTAPDRLSRSSNGSRPATTRPWPTWPDAYGAKMHQLALRYTRNQEDAEEVVQDVLMKVRDKIDAFRGDAALSSWIYRITFNTAMSRLRATRSTRAARGARRAGRPQRRHHAAQRSSPPTGRTSATSWCTAARCATPCARGRGAAGHLPRAGDPARSARAVHRGGEPAAQGEGPDAEVATAPRPAHPARAPRRLRWRLVPAPPRRRLLGRGGAPAGG